MRTSFGHLAPFFVLFAALPACSSSASPETTSTVHDAGRHVDAELTGHEGGSSREASVEEDAPAAADGSLEGGDREASVDASAPTLTALEVSPLALTPGFEPAIHDYYVRCAAGKNDLTLTMTASGGAKASVTQPTASLGKKDFSVGVSPNDAIIVTAADAAGRTDYWIRCLPPDFPAVTMTTRQGVEPPTAGYYLVTSTVLANEDSGYAMVLDADGVPVWYHEAASKAPLANLELRAANVLSFVSDNPYTFGDRDGAYEIHALDSLHVKHVAPVGLPLDLHELQQLPNGDYLVFAWPILRGVDLTGLAAYGTNEDMIDCVVQEVSPSGEKVWEWDAMDHLDPVQDCTWPQPALVVDSSGATESVADPFHCNSIDADSDGNLLISARHLDSIFLIEKASGKITWKLGGASYTADDATFVTLESDALGGFRRQHDARFLPNGQISLFDDQTDTTNPARGLTLSYDLSKKTASIVWQYAGEGPSLAMGSTRIMPDTSRLIGWGLSLGVNPALTEVNAGGIALRDVTFPGGDTTYRASKVALTDLDLDLMRKSTATGGD